MIEEGSEWAAHVRTKIHKRLAAKLSKAEQDIFIPAAASKAGKGTDGNLDDATAASLNDLFGS